MIDIFFPCLKCRDVFTYMSADNSESRAENFFLSKSIWYIYLTHNNDNDDEPNQVNRIKEKKEKKIYHQMMINIDICWSICIET